LAALHGRHEFEQGHWKEGWEDVTSLLKLARHVELGPVFIVHLVGYNIENTAIDVAAPYLPELKEVLPKDAAALLDKLPVGPTAAQIVVKEKEVTTTWLIDELKKAEQRKEGSWQEIWKEILGAPGEGEKVDPNVVKSARTFKEAIKLLEDILPL